MRGATDPATPKNIGNAERAAEAVRMRTAGRTFEAIATELNYHDRKAAYNAVMRSIRQIRAEPAAELAAIELDRLDRMLESAWPHMLAGSDQHGRLILRIMQQRARYVQVYSSDASGAQHVGGILEALLKGVMGTGDTTDPMTISEPLDEYDDGEPNDG